MSVQYQIPQLFYSSRSKARFQGGISSFGSLTVAAAVVQLKPVASEPSAALFGQICHLSQMSYYQWVFPVLEEKIYFDQFISAVHHC